MSHDSTGGEKVNFFDDVNDRAKVIPKSGDNTNDMGFLIKFYVLITTARSTGDFVIVKADDSILKSTCDHLY